MTQWQMLQSQSAVCIWPAWIAWLGITMYLYCWQACHTLQVRQPFTL
jgi:hypothetical protein